MISPGNMSWVEVHFNCFTHQTVQRCLGEGITLHKLSLVFFYSHLPKRSHKFLSKLYFHLMALAFFQHVVYVLKIRLMKMAPKWALPVMSSLPLLLASGHHQQNCRTCLSASGRSVTFSSALYVLLESLYMKMQSRERICSIFSCVVHLTF